MTNIVHFDPIYMTYRKMWIEDRWKFSGKMVNLTIKKSREGLNNEEQYVLNILNQIVEEFDGRWLDDYQPPKKIRKRG
jgi:hypothetical protein